MGQMGKHLTVFKKLVLELFYLFVLPGMSGLSEEQQARLDSRKKQNKLNRAQEEEHQALVHDLEQRLADAEVEVCTGYPNVHIVSSAAATKRTTWWFRLHVSRLPGYRPSCRWRGSSELNLLISLEADLSCFLFPTPFHSNPRRCAHLGLYAVPIVQERASLSKS